MNLHGMARGLIQEVFPDETVTLYKSAGFVNIEGTAYPKWEEGREARSQTQTEKEDALAHLTGDLGETPVTRKFYLYASEGDAPQGADRPDGKGGDMIRCPDGTWWLITAVIKDFSRAGWVSVRGALQSAPPDFSHSQWSADENDLP